MFKLLIKLLSNIIEILKTISKSAITERKFFFIIQYHFRAYVRCKNVFIYLTILYSASNVHDIGGKKNRAQCHGQSSKNSITLTYGLNHTSGGKCNAIMGRMAAAYFHRLVRGKV